MAEMNVVMDSTFITKLLAALAAATPVVATGGTTGGGGTGGGTSGGGISNGTGLRNTSTFRILTEDGSGYIQTEEGNGSYIIQEAGMGNPGSTLSAIKIVNSAGAIFFKYLATNIGQF